MPNTERRAGIEARARALSDEAAALSAEVKDPGIKGLIDLQVSRYASDVLGFFLRQQVLPVHEEWWLDESERLIALAGQQLESLRATIAKYGGPDKIKTAG